MKPVMFWYFLLYIGLAFASECQHRDYGQGATVCVCNVTHCDNFVPLEKTSKGVLTSYVTSKSGNRFAKSQLHFSENPIKTNKQTIVINIDRNQKFQKILGFGGAFTDAAGINIAKLPDNLQKRLIQDYFGSDGIEYSMARIPIGGCDFSTRAYSYDDHPGDDTLSKFALQEEDFKFKIPYIKMAQEVNSGQLKLFGSPWSSPAWMKTNNKLNNGGFLIGTPGGKYYKMFAKYFVRFLQEYSKQNVSIWGITVENEPSFGIDPYYNFNSLGFNSTLERDFVKLDLGPELHKSGYKDLKVMIYDDNVVTISFNMPDYVDTVLSDNDAVQYVSGIAFHWYGNLFFPDRKPFEEIHSKYPNHFLLSTEACLIMLEKTKQVPLGNWTDFNHYANDILQDLNYFASGWIDWNLVLDLEGGPNWVNNFVNAAIIVNETSQEYYKQPFYYALGHFSKFLPPESVRLNCTIQNPNTNVKIGVFERPDNGTVMIVHNQNNHSIELNVNDPDNGKINFDIHPDSLTSLIWYS